MSKMSCSGCIFSIMDTGPPMSGGPFAGSQIGCEADRLQRYIDKNVAEKTAGETFYDLGRFCNLYRNEEWETQLGEECDDILAKARKESMPSFGVVVFDKPEYIDAELIGTLKSIEDIDYDTKKVQVMIRSHESRGIEFLVAQVEKLRSLGFKASMIIQDQGLPKDYRDKDTFMKIFHNHYFVSFNVGDLIPDGFFNEINTSLNIRGENICAFQAGNVVAIPRQVVRNEYLNYNDYEKMTEGVLEAAKHGGLYLAYEK